MHTPTQQAPSGDGGGGGPSLPSPPSLGDFLSTDQGAAWLAVTVDEWEQKLLRMKHDAQSASVSGLNGWLQTSFNELQSSEKGRILVAKLQVRAPLTADVIKALWVLVYRYLTLLPALPSTRLNDAGLFTSFSLVSAELI